MKILAVHSSPRKEGESKTERMLRHLVQGMKEAGAEVETVALREKTVKPCIGCFTCWTKTPGVCIHKDDMSQELFPKWMEADLVVNATPLYHFTMNATLKAFIERTLPLLEPFLVERGGRTFHPLRRPHPKMVFLSVAGFPEAAVFDQLQAWVRFLYGRNDTLVAEIYRPAAETLFMPFFKEKREDILGATVQAGREIVRDLKVSPETLARVCQPLVSETTGFFKMGNLMWKTCIAEKVTPAEFAHRGMLPRPDSLETFLMLMTTGFRPEAAGDITAVLQFAFSGEVSGTCHLAIAAGKIQGLLGEAASPSVTIEAPFETWMDIVTGKANGQELFMQGKFKAQGDFSLLMNMARWYRD